MTEIVDETSISKADPSPNLEKSVAHLRVTLEVTERGLVRFWRPIELRSAAAAGRSNELRPGTLFVES
jgi:hypothetical protein